VNQHRYNGDVDTVTYQGRTIRIEWLQDDCCGAPWDETDCYGTVKGWQQSDKAPGEVILCRSWGSKLIYDFAGSVADWKKQGVSGQDADRYATHSVKRLKAHLSDHWSYLRAKVTIDGLEYEEYLGSIESDYAADVISDLLIEAKHAIDKHQRNLVAVMRLLLVGV
jgi:hypothetical protein